MKHLLINESDLVGLYSGARSEHFSLADCALCSLQMKSQKIDDALRYMEASFVASQATRVEMSSTPLCASIYLGYVLKGQSVHYITGWPEPREMEAGQFCLLYSPTMQGYSDYRAKQAVSSCGLYMDVALLSQLLEQEPRPQITSLFRPIFDRPHKSFVLFGSISSGMGKCLGELYQQPDFGMMNGFSRRAAAYELLQLSLDRIIDTHCQDLGRVKLTITDVQRLEQVKTVLQKQLPSPPSLAQLAKIVGLNESKLKQGFKQLNQKTVFEYLLELRMRKSSQLLESSQMPIIDIALQVGYHNHGHFSAAFRHFFGKTPSMHRRSYVAATPKVCDLG